MTEAFRIVEKTLRDWKLQLLAEFWAQDITGVGDLLIVAEQAKSREPTIVINNVVFRMQ